MSKYVAFTLSSNGGLLRCLKTDVYVCLPEKLQHQAKAQAVWDTGATVTCISPNIATDLELRSIGFSHMNTANGLTRVPRYKIALILPNKVLITDLTVHGFCGCPDVDMLIGMDVICMGDFSLTHANGKTVMSYRMPSDGIPIDYVRAMDKGKGGKITKAQIKRYQKL